MNLLLQILFLMYVQPNSSAITSVSYSCDKSIKVAIIDTGLDLTDRRFEGKLCNKGHSYFAGESIKDKHGHGTHIAGLILKHAKESDYCMLIYKFYDKLFEGQATTERLTSAMQEAINNGANIVNISGGGANPFFFEKEIIKNNPNVIFVVAAGNHSSNLDIPGNEYYPASYWLPNQIVVSALNKGGTRLHYSNWSKKSISELGENVVSFLPNGREGPITGTSQATAIATGKLVLQINSRCGR